MIEEDDDDEDDYNNMQQQSVPTSCLAFDGDNLMSVTAPVADDAAGI